MPADDTIVVPFALHVIPVDDHRGDEPMHHFASPHCPCFPVQPDPDVVPNLWVHNAWDLRDAHERQPGYTNPPGKGWMRVGQILLPT